MFTLIEKYKIDRIISKCDFIRLSVAETTTKNTRNSQLYINKSREDSVFSLLKSYLDINLEVI